MSGRGLIEFADAFSQELRPGEVIGSQSDSGAVRLGMDAEACLSVEGGALRIAPASLPGWGRQGLAYGPLPHRPGLALGVFLLPGHLNAQSADGTLRESLAVGFFESLLPPNPLEAGPAFVVQAHPEAHGRLCAAKRRGLHPLLWGLPALPLYLLLVLRERGVVFYAGALEAGRHLPALPLLRPLAVEPYAPPAQRLYAGIFQAVAGEQGYQADTRVYGVRAALWPEGAGWGTALAADPQPQLGRRAARGGVWRLETAGMVLYPEAPGGLLHVRLLPPAVLRWRYLDPEHHLALELTGREARLRLRYGSQSLVLAAGPDEGEPTAPRWVQVLDDGRYLGISLDGRPLFPEPLLEPRLAEAHGVGLVGQGADLEVHPREIRLPPWLEPARPALPRGDRVVLDPRLDQPSEALLLFWEPTLGPGRLEPAEGGVRLEGSGRTFYTVPWAVAWADLEAEILPAPRCRAGVGFWQDAGHHLVVALELGEGMSRLAAHLRFAGYEDPRRAVWVGLPGLESQRPFRLRVVLDGERFLAYLDDEPVLYRALQDIYPGAERLETRRVGLALSGYGEDRGSIFRSWKARR
ncbi:hypothetical protein DV704_04585 [Meiothermus sp. QL-1]|uniref:hypothetical protein n=1 Tax=Meiothermus sp. QL-1 TaxID=2058095 RepID=UPI000E0AA0E9|nr:hypothetical protein [Meiothermus sp. QL-1]RDI96192.1 hypothetical protein DV704_04585 [Meiothermus sp. QL-1]